MRYFIWCISVVLFATLDTYAYPTTVDHVSPPKEKKKKPSKRERGNQFGLALPGWLIRTGINIVVKPKQMERTERALYNKIRPAMRRIRGIRLLVTDRPEASRKATRMRQRFFNPQSRKRVEPMIKVRDGDTKVDLFVKVRRTKKKTIIKKLVCLVEDDGELVLVVLNGRWDTKMIQQLIKEVKVTAMTELFD